MGRRAVSRSSRFTVAAGLLAGTALATLSVPSSAATPVVAQRAFFAKLQAVSASSPSDAWAVGFRQQAVGDNTLAMTKHRDGHSWSIIDPPPTPPQAGTTLDSISMDRANDGFVVGEASSAGRGTSYTARWDGTTWSR